MILVVATHPVDPDHDCGTGGGRVQSVLSRTPDVQGQAVFVIGGIIPGSDTDVRAGGREGRSVEGRIQRQDLTPLWRSESAGAVGRTTIPDTWDFVSTIFRQKTRG